MKPRDLTSLLLLGALWGGSFLFMRMAADPFGAVAMGGMRAIVAGLCFVPMMASHTLLAEWRAHWRPIAITGIANSALPFLLFAWAARHLPAGLSSIFDAITPLLVAASGWLWLNEKLDAWRTLGLVVGLIGVLWLVGGNIGGATVDRSSLWAMAACVGATVCYAFAVHYSRRRLHNVSPMTSTAGSQIVAAILLAPTTFWAWPAQNPPMSAWLAIGALGVACTGFAMLLFFRLLARTGTARTMTVLYLIPVFGVLWGWLFLREAITANMIIACVVILLGVALTTGRTSEPLPAPIADKA